MSDFKTRVCYGLNCVPLQHLFETLAPNVMVFKDGTFGRWLRFRWGHEGSILMMGLLLLSHFSLVGLCATPWTVAHQAPLSMEFSRQKYWSGLPRPPLEDLPNPGIKPGLLHCRQILYCLRHQRCQLQQGFLFGRNWQTNFKIHMKIQTTSTIIKTTVKKKFEILLILRLPIKLD